VTAEDVGRFLLGRAVRDYPVLADGRVLFVGQRIAAVAAVDRESARAAAALVEVEYAELPPVLGLDAAMALDDDHLHPGYADYDGAVAGRPGPNSQGISATRSGAVDTAFAQAARVFDDTFTCGRSHPAPLEPRACLVSVGAGRVDIWSTHKEPHTLRRNVAEFCGRDLSEVRVHLAPIGGDFGSKGFPFVELVCVAIAARTGRPVRHTMSYDEELTTTAARHPLRMRLRTAVDQDARLCAVDVETALDGGAFAALKAVPTAVLPLIGAPFGSYRVESRHERCVSYYSTTLPGGHVRSPGEFQALFAAESQVDMIAADLGLDPIEFRLANAADDRVRRVLEEVRSGVADWRSTGPPDAGIGMALCFRDTGPGLSTVRAVATADGVEIQVTVADQGAGSYTAFRALAAEALAVPLGSVSVRSVDVGGDAFLRDAGAGASRVTAVSGGAVVEACGALTRVLGGRPEGQPAGFWLADRLTGLGIAEASAYGTASAGWPAPPGVDVRSHGAVAVEVSVDRETGQITVHRALVVADTGQVFNPVAHRGQLEGGFVYGLSQTLLEELVVEDGQVVTASLGDYRIASSADVPPLAVRVLTPAGEGPILSVGELTNVGVAPAVANAVAAATGVRLRELPLTPDRVLAALAG
jgi:CO/xanthine dehydrogenase Mo-binding subunit